MDFDKYQEATANTAVYPGQGEPLGLMYAALGLGNEAGEVQGKIKKAIRDENYGDPEVDVWSNCDCCGYDAAIIYESLCDARKKAIADELGDVLWYAAQVASEIGYPLANIAEANLAKLFDRKVRGVIAGDGDNR